MGHDHTGHAASSAGWVLFEIVAVVVLLAAALAYGVALWAARYRSPWPLRRTLFWYTGLVSLGVGIAGPLAQAAHASFTAHMAAHLLLGMTGPLLLVLGAPITLALRALPVAGARALTRILRTPYVRVATHPAVAALLNAGGLWLLYTTPLYTLMHESVLVHAMVHAHIVLAGYLFTASLIGLDPDPHRSSMAVRSVVLIAFIAAHSVLGKWLYAHPPAGVDAADGRRGAQLMYYGGDVVDVLIIVLLFTGWYAATRPRHGLLPAHAAGA